MSTDLPTTTAIQKYEPFSKNPFTNSLLKDRSYTHHTRDPTPNLDPNTATTTPTSWQEMQDGNPFFRVTCCCSSAVQATLFLSRTPTQSRTPSTEAEAEAEAEGHLLLHVGPGITGQTGIAHGGFLATALDEVCGNLVAVAGLDGGCGMFTAQLGVVYRRPVFVPEGGTVIVATARVVGVEGRKVFIEGVVRDGDGVVCTTAEAVFVRKRAGDSAVL
ncbi:PaaI family thioesterase [Aspergillus mulundensis]|uniref:Thioesterase domain-containing protein n=1 Tax=Aspergillus mulundensis TaxID=1810919 RepID=A0A3D8RKE5_9EURO|nr:hypothetical protein DSM5745_07165 [Aspergillus mulundensis]RDW74503.1 hypothetical protein DSM5745_07165 [Aspergillus mulundensis]